MDSIIASPQADEQKYQPQNIISLERTSREERLANKVVTPCPSASFCISGASNPSLTSVRNAMFLSQVKIFANFYVADVSLNCSTRHKWSQSATYSDFWNMGKRNLNNLCLYLYIQMSFG